MLDPVVIAAQRAFRTQVNRLPLEPRDRARLCELAEEMADVVGEAYAREEERRVFATVRNMLDTAMTAPGRTHHSVGPYAVRPGEED